MPPLLPVALPHSSAIAILGSIPLGYSVTVVAVVSYDIVVRAERRHSADRNGFLSDIEVQEAANLALHVKASACFLESSNQQHLPIELG